MTVSLSHDELPVPDYDHLTVGALPGHISSLTEDQVQQLLDYERSHAHRLPIVVVLENRIAALRGGATPSDSEPGSPSPEVNVSPGGGSRVDPATSGPPINPPSHGDPTNPAQPR